MKSDVQRLLRLGLISEAREAYRRLGNPSLADRLAFLTAESETGHRYELISAVERFHQLSDSNLAAEALAPFRKAIIQSWQTFRGTGLLSPGLTRSRVGSSATQWRASRRAKSNRLSALSSRSKSALAAFPMLRRATNRAATSLALDSFPSPGLRNRDKARQRVQSGGELDLSVLHLPGAENRILEARASILAVFLSSTSLIYRKLGDMQQRLFGLLEPAELVR